MSKRENPVPTGPRPWVKWVVSLVIVVHFMAILTVVTSAASGNFAPSPIALKVNEPFRPYTQITFLTNPYRFYAPEPGPTNLLWLRLTHEDQSVRWVELPNRDEFILRMPYQRHLSIAMMVEQPTRFVPPNHREMNRNVQICLSSYARYVAKADERVKPDGTPNRVTGVDLYYAPHRQLWPDEIRLGMDFNDIRTYMFTYAGHYNPEGVRTDVAPTQRGYAALRATSEVVAQILEEDVLPLLKDRAPSERLYVLEEVRIPKPIRELAAKAPELLDPTQSPTNLQRRIMEAVSSRDEPTMKARMEAEGRYINEW